MAWLAVTVTKNLVGGTQSWMGMESMGAGAIMTHWQDTGLYPWFQEWEGGLTGMGLTRPGEK